MPWTEIRGPGGSSLPTVRAVHAVGSVFCVAMLAPVDQPNTLGTEIWNSDEGAKLIEIYVNERPADVKRMIVGWSTTSGDTAVEINLLAALTANGIEYPNQRPITIDVPYAVIPWDGVTTIKRVSVVSETTDRAYFLVATY
jgi:hypothetical protein